MIDRIQLILKSKNLSSTLFADEINVQRSSVSHILTGRNKPSLDFITKILHAYPEINSEWLLMGEGQMLKKSEPVSQPKPENENLFVSQEKNKEEKKQLDDHKTEKSEKKEPDLEKAEITTSSGSGIKKIMILYDDNTFKEFFPKE